MIQTFYGAPLPPEKKPRLINEKIIQKKSEIKKKQTVTVPLLFMSNWAT